MLLQKYFFLKAHLALLIALRYFFFSNVKNRLGRATLKSSNRVEENGKQHHNQSSSAPTRDLASFADEYRKLAIDCLKVLRVEMQLETIFHMQV